ncbi:MAG: phenylalanine--tRNA ligase subunit alpha [Patescibacteria group bacterium]
MKDSLEKLRAEFTEAVKTVSNSEALEALRIEFLGRKGKLAEILIGLPELAGDARKEAGILGNEVKRALEAGFADLTETIRKSELSAARDREWIDISRPGTEPGVGHLHPVSQAVQEILGIFSGLGFSRARTPEVEWDYYAFEALNMPKGHVARDEWETFFMADGEKIAEEAKGKIVLTPHTSNSQVREIEKKQFPIRMININKCYRRQSDLRHAPMFHQFEGLLIDKEISIADLRGTLDYFAKAFFGPNRVTRLRPHHFRFTEPSFEIDISCGLCNGTGKLEDGTVCRMCKRGWLELGGAGMVHPNVLKAGGLDPATCSGFAFGWGIERTLMMKSGMNIDDIRILYRNDLRFLKQF